MKLAIMQPYLFPYIGYFQLLEAVDTFVVYDDVQFINKGWINRNRILNAGQAQMFSVPLAKAPREALINERVISGGWKSDREKFLKTVHRAYAKAPYFESCFDLVSRLVRHEEERLSDYVVHALSGVASFLGIETPVVKSSELTLTGSYAGEERIIDICKGMKATTYINAAGGRELYHPDSFSAQGMELLFIQTQNIEYTQFKNEFVPWLSIIDVMMFNPVSEIRNYLNCFELES